MNNIDSVDEERQMRKDVKKLILEKQLMMKVLSQNTFHFSFSSLESVNHIGAQTVSCFEMNVPNHPKGHIKNARLRINSIVFTTINQTNINNALKNVRQIQPYISIVKNNQYSSRIVNTHFKLQELGGITNTLSMVLDGVRSSHALIDTDMFYACENPFGKKIRVELYNTLGTILNIGSPAFNTCIFNFEVQLLPDFNENDRINY
jgi:hypothetical protein